MDNQKDLENSINKFSELTLKGLETTQGKQWLDDWYAHFDKFCEEVRQHLKDNECNNDEIGVCIIQIFGCFKHFERIFQAEALLHICLTVNRRHFLARLEWCFQRIKSCLSHIQTSKDNILDTHFLTSTEKMADEIVQQKFENMERLLHDIFEKVAFCAKDTTEDKTPLIVCQRTKQSFGLLKKEYVLGNFQIIPTKTLGLGISLFHLDEHLKKRLINMFYNTFGASENYVLEGLSLEQFESDMEKAIYIGVYAIASTTDHTLRLQLRSSLASFEALKPCLIRVLNSKTSVIDSPILCKHFQEEMSVFIKGVLTSIPRIAFCDGYYQIVKKFTQEFSLSITIADLDAIISKGHLLLNRLKIQVITNTLVRNSLDQFVTAFNWCKYGVVSLQNFKELEASALLIYLELDKIEGNTCHQLIESYVDIDECVKILHKQMNLPKTTDILYANMYSNPMRSSSESKLTKIYRIKVDTLSKDMLMVYLKQKAIYNGTQLSTSLENSNVNVDTTYLIEFYFSA